MKKLLLLTIINIQANNQWNQLLDQKVSLKHPSSCGELLNNKKAFL